MKQGPERTPDEINCTGAVGLEKKADTLCPEIEGKWGEKSIDLHILVGRK